MRSAATRRTTAALAIALSVAVGPAAPIAGAQTPAGDDDLVLRVGVVSDLITDNPWAVSAGATGRSSPCSTT